MNRKSDEEMHGNLKTLTGIHDDDDDGSISLVKFSSSSETSRVHQKQSVADSVATFASLCQQVLHIN
jgi:hypothetical protein